MIYDCFPFFNELDVLDIRLNELNDVVDRFVLVEATHTFQNEPKPLYFNENKQRYKQFLPKIEHVVVDKFPGFFYRWRKPTPWDCSNFQKDQVALGLKNCLPDDVIIVSDVDEIPAPDKILEYKNVSGIKVFEQIWSNFYFNYVAKQCDSHGCMLYKNEICYWKGSVMVNYRDFTSFKKVRMKRGLSEGVISIDNGGWHFSFIGDFEMIRKKLDAWEHSKESMYDLEHLYNEESVKKIISTGADLFGRDISFAAVELDERFPKYLRLKKDSYSSLLY